MNRPYGSRRSQQTAQRPTTKRRNRQTFFCILLIVVIFFIAQKLISFQQSASPAPTQDVSSALASAAPQE